MKTLRRNDPCPCGSGKRYKHCCLQKEEPEATSDSYEAIPKAFSWLMAKHPDALGEPLDNGFFGGLNEHDYKRLQAHKSFPDMMVSAFEWLLAEGTLPVKGRELRVSELLLERGGPSFSTPQRQWIEGLATTSLRLYEVVEVVPRKSISLKDVLLPERLPVLVSEKSGSERLVKFDLIAARIVPGDDQFVLAGAVNLIPRDRGPELIGALRKERQGLALDAPEAKKRVSQSISTYWLKLFLTPLSGARDR